VGEDAVALLALGSAGGGGGELVLATDQEVAGGWVTTALVATSADRRVALFKTSKS